MWLCQSGFRPGGLLASWLVRTFGWPAIFALGGMLPLCLLPLVALWLPESTRREAAPHRKSLVPLLFKDGLAPTTLLLWPINALSYINVYFMLLWIPALLHSTGVDSARAIFGTTLFGIGGVVSPVLAALVATRFGLSRALTFGLMVGAFCILLIGLLHPDFWLLALMLCGAGIGGGCQGGINSLSALAYPRSVRSTGVGWALGVGRVGTIAGPLLGGQLLSLGVGVQKIFLTASIPVFAAAILVAFLR
jgi:MFS transporter, AAHS family, 4-hydroxybenzoate transporter